MTVQRKRRIRRRRIGRGLFNSYVLPNLPELHFRGFDSGFKKYNFAGPGTRLDRRLIPGTKTPHDWSKPINRVDEAAYHHDLAYEASSDHAARKHADDVMINQLKQVRRDKKARWTERADAALVEAAMRSKRLLGLGKKHRALIIHKRRVMHK